MFQCSTAVPEEAPYRHHSAAEYGEAAALRLTQRYSTFCMRLAYWSHFTDKETPGAVQARGAVEAAWARYQEDLSNANGRIESTAIKVYPLAQPLDPVNRDLFGSEFGYGGAK